MNSVKKYFQVLIVVGIVIVLMIGLTNYYSYIFSRRVKGVVERVEKVQINVALMQTTSTDAINPQLYSFAVGIKEASGDLMQCIEIVKGTSGDFILTAGDDLLSVPMASIGGKGSISVLSNIFPKEFATMVRSAVNGDFAKANQILHTFLEINPLLYLEGNPVGAKYVLSELNVLGADVRLPLSAASENLRAKLSAALKKYQNSK